MPPVAPGGEVGQLLQAVLDEKAMSKRGFARRLKELNGGEIESWRSQVGRILDGQVPQRRTAILLATALDKPADFFLPEPDTAAVDAAILSRIVELLEANPHATEELAPLLQELADQLGEMSFRLRQAAEPPNEHSQPS